MDPLRRLAPAGYCIAALLIAITLIDYLGNAWPFRPGAVDWRYGVVGMLSTYLASPLLGCLIASVVAAWMPHPRVSRLLGVLGLLAAVLLLIGLGGFALDSLQVRSSAAPNAKWVTLTSFLLASLKLGAGVIVLVVLGIGNWRAAKASAASLAESRKRPMKPVIGQ